MGTKTLGGVFSQPKMNHRRDFLRENKLSLRDLQKITTQKLSQQKQEHENRQYKHIQKFHKIREQSMGRTSVSESENVEQKFNRERRVKTQNGMINDGLGTGAVIRGAQNGLASRRSISQQRNKADNFQIASTCCCSQHHEKIKQSDTQYRECMPRTSSTVSDLSKAESCDKEIQTEDIHDEHFLYTALKKCSSDSQRLQKQKSLDTLSCRNNCNQDANSNHNVQQCDHELISSRSHDYGPCIYTDHYEGNKFEYNEKQNNKLVNEHIHTPDDEIIDDANQNFDKHLRNLKIATDIGKESESRLSARSRQTMCSTSSKRSVHKLGSREDVLLPRYLEKEKREREEERIRELNKDLNCPMDHYTLSEQERLTALTKAKQKMESLINELNHMPMTMETLRIRKRKVEIEKELTQIESDIRLYSKPKVYIPITALQH